LFAFECLSDRLGLLFEPYVISIVPVLLKSFSHSSDHVREAAQIAAKVIMNRLSAHGVKQVLNPILSSLTSESAWKSRQEAIRLLGTMAYCAPKQLASCLPQIVPKLVEAGSDPHPKVKESAKNAMADITSVVKNPEILQLSPILLGALGDPANRTKEALEALLDCEFMHSIDAPSLALLVPVLGRALRDRSADLKRKSSAICGNMMTMCNDAKILVPYLSQMLPGLQDCLLDPIPDVRATSAKALGSLVGGVGESELSEVIPWLLETMRSDLSPVERSGAAQGLAEVCFALGESRVVEILEVVLPLQNSAKSGGREGLLWLLSFLPAALPESFAPHITETLPVILFGLSDENESVREVAMRAGQILVSTLGKKHALLILPALNEGMFDDDWRIRHSSVKLLGDLFYLIGDAKAIGVADGEDDEEEAGVQNVTSSSRVLVTIRAHIGQDQADSVLSSLYIVRSDSASVVRQTSLQVWKSVVSNTPRTLVEMMPALVQQLISKLSAESAELRFVAGRALGEVVRKQGDRILPTVIPLLKRGLLSADEGMRQGICLGLAEIMGAASRKQIEDFIDILIPALQAALCDLSEEVRTQAAKAFNTLFKSIGVMAIEEIVPSLLAKLSDTGATDDDGEQAVLLGLRQIVQIRPRDLLEYLIPKLTKSPMALSSAQALASIVEVAGASLVYHYSYVIPSVVSELYAANGAIEMMRLEGRDGDEGFKEETERFNAVRGYAVAVMGSVPTAGVNSISTELGRQIEHETDARRRQWGCRLTEMFVRHSKAEYNEYVPIILKYLLGRVAEADKELLQAVVDALLAISTTISLDELVNHIDFMKNCISSTASDARHRTGAASMLSDSGEFILPLFTIPKSLEPFFTIFIHGLMNGSVDVREIAADAIGELALISDVSVLKPHFIKTTGPLIRVVGDRFPSNIKTAILQVSVCRFVHGILQYDTCVVCMYG
jgi:HEAT repeat protein